MGFTPRLDWNATAVALALGAAPVIGIAAPLAMAPLLVIAGILAGIGAWRERALPSWHHPALIVCGLLLLWSIVSSGWALDARQAIFGSAKLALNAGLGLLLVTAAQRCQSRNLGLVVLLAGAIAVAALYLEYSTGNGVSYWRQSLSNHEGMIGKSLMNRGVAVFSCLCWPFLALIFDRFGARAAIPSLLAIVGAVLISDNSTAKVAFLAAMLTAAATAWTPVGVTRVLRVALPTLVLIGPLLAQQLPPPQQTFTQWREMPTSLHHRLTIWRFAAERIAENPLVGWGFDAARVIPGGEDNVELSRPSATGSNVATTLVEQQMPLHPHNAILHVWMELGLVGAGLLAALLWLLTGACGRIESPGLSRPATMAALLATFIVGNMSFGFWQSWWQGSLWIIFAACTIRSPRRPEQI